MKVSGFTEKIHWEEAKPKIVTGAKLLCFSTLGSAAFIAATLAPPIIGGLGLLATAGTMLLAGLSIMNGGNVFLAYPMVVAGIATLVLFGIASVVAGVAIWHFGRKAASKAIDNFDSLFGAHVKENLREQVDIIRNSHNRIRKIVRLASLLTLPAVPVAGGLGILSLGVSITFPSAIAVGLISGITIPILYEIFQSMKKKDTYDV